MSNKAEIVFEKIAVSLGMYSKALANRVAKVNNTINVADKATGIKKTLTQMENIGNMKTQSVANSLEKFKNVDLSNKKDQFNKYLAESSDRYSMALENIRAAKSMSRLRL